MSYTDKYLKYLNKNNHLKGGIVTTDNIVDLTMKDIMENIYLIHVLKIDDFINNSNFKRIPNDPDNIKWTYRSLDMYPEKIGSSKMIHTVWSTHVLPHRNGQWNYPNNKVAIVTPLKLQEGKIYKINPNDTMIMNHLILNKDSIIIIPTHTYIKYNPKLKQSDEDPNEELEINSFEELKNEKHQLRINKFKESMDLYLDFDSDFNEHKIDLSVIFYDNSKADDEKQNTCIQATLSKLNDNDKMVFNHFIDKIKQYEYVDSSNFMGLMSYFVLEPLEKYCDVDKTIDECFKNMNMQNYTIEQINKLLPMAVRCIYKETLFDKVNSITHNKNLFINSHCVNGTVIDYSHPTPCFNYKGKNYNIYDVVEQKLKKEIGTLKELYGRHYGVSNFRGTDVIDQIQDFNSGRFPGENKNKFYDHVKQTYPDKNDYINDLKNKFKELSSRNENQFPLKKEYLDLIEAELNEMIQYFLTKDD
jgi:hypothetical protein